MSASPEQVAAAQEALGCEEESGDLDFQANPLYCAEHVSGRGDHVLWTDRGCPVAVQAADAVVAAGPDPAKVAAETLREAARILGHRDCPQDPDRDPYIGCVCRVSLLYARAARIEAGDQ